MTFERNPNRILLLFVLTVMRLTDSAATPNLDPQSEVPPNDEPVRRRLTGGCKRGLQEAWITEKVAGQDVYIRTPAVIFTHGGHQTYIAKDKFYHAPENQWIAKETLRRADGVFLLPAGTYVYVNKEGFLSLDPKCHTEVAAAASPCQYQGLTFPVCELKNQIPAFLGKKKSELALRQERAAKSPTQRAFARVERVEKQIEDLTKLIDTCIEEVEEKKRISSCESAQELTVQQRRRKQLIDGFTLKAETAKQNFADTEQARKLLLAEDAVVGNKEVKKLKGAAEAANLELDLAKQVAGRVVDLEDQIAKIQRQVRRPSGQKPRMFVLWGGFGAGKSTATPQIFKYLGMKKQSRPNDVTMEDFDVVKLGIDDIVENEVPAFKEAFENWTALKEMKGSCSNEETTKENVKWRKPAKAVILGPLATAAVNAGLDIMLEWTGDENMVKLSGYKKGDAIDFFDADTMEKIVEDYEVVLILVENRDTPEKVMAQVVKRESENPRSVGTWVKYVFSQDRAAQFLQTTKAMQGNANFNDEQGNPKFKALVVTRLDTRSNYRGVPIDVSGIKPLPFDRTITKGGDQKAFPYGLQSSYGVMDEQDARDWIDAVRHLKRYPNASPFYGSFSGPNEVLDSLDTEARMAEL